MAQIPDLVVTNGPGKFDLMVSLFEGATARKKVRFVVQGFKEDIWVNITLVEQEAVEQGAGNSEGWNIGGYVNGLHIQGYYSTWSRKGTLSLVPRMEIRSDPSRPEVSPSDMERIINFITRMKSWK